MAQSFVFFIIIGALRWDNVGSFFCWIDVNNGYKVYAYFSYMKFFAGLIWDKWDQFFLKKTSWDFITFLLGLVGLIDFVNLYRGLVTWFAWHDNHVSRGRSPCVFDERSLVLWRSLFINLVAFECYWNGASWLQIKFWLQTWIYKWISYYDQCPLFTIRNTFSMNGNN